MLNLSKNRKKLILSHNNLRPKYHINGVPDEYVGSYFQALNPLVRHHKNIVDAIFNHKELGIPITTELFEKYMTGFNFSYIPFNGDVTFSRLEGFWRHAPWDNSEIQIFYNENSSTERQRFTQLHELFHFLQSIDMQVVEYINLLVTKFPQVVINKLIDKAADKGASMYLMPERILKQQFGITQNLAELAEKFKVSQQTLAYRAKEVGIKR